MNKVRFRYTKTGRGKYISHLDFMAVMQRAFLRAGIKLKYSEGFNPHPYISVALPLSVGCESVCELMDVGVDGYSASEIKSIKLPDGISLLEAYGPERKYNDIAWIEISVNMHYENQQKSDIIKKLSICLSKDSIMITKRTKRGFKDIDIAPYIKDIEFKDGEKILFTAKISAQNPTLNADDLVSALDDELKPDFIDVRRIELYDSNMRIFR